MVALKTMQLLHDLGIAYGVAGVTINAILMIKSERDPESAPFIIKIMPTIFKLIWLGLVLLIISGLALSLTSLITWPLK